MTLSLIPVGPQFPDALQAVLQSMQDAILQLQQPGAPNVLVSIDTKANLPTASEWPNCACICAEINSIVASTQVAGTWTWLRADGSSL